MEIFFSSLKTERTAHKTYHTRDEAKAGVFDHIERFYNPRRRHSTLGYLSPMEFENQVLFSLRWCQRNRQRARRLPLWRTSPTSGIGRHQYSPTPGKLRFPKETDAGGTR
jgi:hypothetical protein